MKLFSTYAMVLALIIAAPLVYAHHSTIAYDRTKTLTMSGSVKEWHFTNPHSWLYVVTVDETTNQEVVWKFESGSVSRLARIGWRFDTFKPGDKVVVTFSPSKHEPTEGAIIEVKFAGDNSITEPISAP